MGDLISREAAIRALASSNGDYLDALERFERLPAVDVPLRCKGCSFFAPHKHDRGEDSRCMMLNMEVRENDYCSFGAWTSCEGCRA